MPGLNWIEATVEIVHHCPNTKVVALSGYDGKVSAMNAIKPGVSGYIVKRASILDMLDGIRTVARGGSYLSPQVADRLVRRIHQRGNTSSSDLASFC